MKGFLEDPELVSFFDYHGIKPCKFSQYFKGASKLGSMVEVIVKLTKRMLFGAIRNLIIDFLEFELLIDYIISLLNKRPVAFKNELRANDNHDIPEPISPELLMKGYETVSVNFVPNVPVPEKLDPDWNLASSKPIESGYKHFQTVIGRVKEVYYNEFMQHIMNQAVDRDNRYKPVSHKQVNVGDIVILKEENCKPNYFPLGIVEGIIKNELDEVTGAVVRKGKTREKVKRHSSTLIPVLGFNGPEFENPPVPPPENKPLPAKVVRKAAQVARDKISSIVKNV